MGGSGTAAETDELPAVCPPSTDAADVMQSVGCLVTGIVGEPAVMDSQ